MNNNKKREHRANERPARQSNSRGQFCRDRRERKPGMTEEDRFIVCGLHPVEEALQMIPAQMLAKSKLYIAETRETKDVEPILEICREIQIDPIAVPMQELTRRTGETRHQGVLLELPQFQYTELDDVLEHLSAQPLIVVLDQIQDPHNLGAIIRSAAAFGADAVVIPKDRAAQMTSTSIKTSAGQAYRIPVCRVSNIAQTLRQLKDLDFHIVGADIEGDAETSIDYHRATVLIMGSEGSGMRRLTRTLCDQMVRIAQNPAVESLNVSVASAILLYTASKQRTLQWNG